MGYLYKMTDDNDNILYIGKTKDINKRLLSHSTEIKKDNWYSKYVKNIYVAKIINKYELDIMEIYLIGKYKPKYNRQFIYEEDFPEKLVSNKKLDFTNIKDLKGIGDKERVFLPTDYILNNINLDHIIIYEGKLNDIGNHKYSFTDKWFSGLSENELDKIRRNTYSYFKNNTFTRSKENIWTCPVDCYEKVKDKGYTRGFVHINSESSRVGVKSIGFLYNVIFKNKIKDYDNALNILLNFIYSNYSNDNLNIYIPNKDMRKLLIKIKEMGHE